MFQFVFIRVVHLLINHFLHILFGLFTLSSVHLSVVVFNHHHTTLFVMPGYLGLLTHHLMVLVTDEKGFGEGTVQHHYQCTNCEESWEVSFFQVIQ